MAKKASAQGKAEEKIEETLPQLLKEDALTVLRTETALSRFPLHRLTKGKNVQIELDNQASAVLWRVDHNSRYGQPGALAYKIDSLYINRRIEEVNRPVPKMIRLGSLREIALEVGSGTNTTPVKQALLQNATASITAKINYRTQDGGEQWLEAVFNRYSVVFTGEKLPDGRSADAVYLVLNDLYQQVLNSAVFRPLDYDYMKSLPPISQRFYEIVSYQIYAALRHNNPRAKVLYSEYCLLSTGTRYFDFEHVKKQIYKVVRPHIKSGYIAKIEYEAFTNERNEPDWIMYLTPGVNAGREFHAFTALTKTRKPRRTATEASAVESLALPFPQAGDAADKPEEEKDKSVNSEYEALVEQLVAADLNRSDARRFASEQPEVCRRQLEFLAFVRQFKSSRGAYLRRAIENDFGPPAAYKRQQSLAKQEKTREEENQNSKAEEEQRLLAESERICSRLSEWEQTHPEALQAFVEMEEQQRRTLQKGPLANRPLTQHALEVFDAVPVRAERIIEFCRSHGQRFGLDALDK